MKKAPFMAALVLLLAGCAAQGESSGGDVRKESSSAAAEEQSSESSESDSAVEEKNEIRENDKFYLEESGNGFAEYVSGDGKLKERLDYRWEDGDVKYRFSLTNCTDEQMQFDNEHCVLSLSFNNTEKCFPIYVDLVLKVDTAEAGETLPQRTEKQLGCAEYISDADDVNSWNDNGGNTLWLSAQGRVTVIDGDTEKTYSFPDFGAEDCFMFSLETQ